jgi:hypothetical protein
MIIPLLILHNSIIISSIAEAQYELSDIKETTTYLSLGRLSARIFQPAGFRPRMD